MAIILPTNTICNTIAHNVAYNANYDIIWSFDYSLSGNNTSQGSFTTFLFNGLSSLGGGAPGPGGAYYSAGQYLSGGNTLIIPSVSGAILGINFDTTGLFALSGSTANGLLTSIPKSLSIRYGGTNFNYLTSVSLTSLYTDFNLLLSAQEYNRLRFRLTDIGQTLKIDYKVVDNFVEILTIPVNLDITDTTTYKIGIGYTTPVSGATATRAIFSIRDFHVEGKTEVPEYDIIQPVNNSFAVYPVCALPGIGTPDTPTDIRTIARIPDVPCPVTDDSQTEINICLADFVVLSGSDSLPISEVSVAGFYTSTLSSPTGSDPVFEPKPIIDGCSTYFSDVISFDGNTRDIVDYPVSYTAIIGAGTGRVNFDYSVYDQSVRFQVLYNGQTVIDTGYTSTNREDIKYNLERELALRNLPAVGLSPLSSNIEFFNKTTSSPQSAEVRVYGPVDGARYTFALLCPIPAPVVYQCGTLITGTNYTSPLTGGYSYTPLITNMGTNTGTIVFAYSAYNLPERFQVLYNNQKIVDTGWVGTPTQQNINWLNSYLLRVGEPTVTTLYSGISSVNILKNLGNVTTMEIRVFAPLYNSTWAVSSTCPPDPTPTKTYIITPSTTSIVEGQSVTYTITTTNVANDTQLSVVNLGSTNDSDFTVAFARTVTITNNSATFTITAATANNSTYEGTETIVAVVRSMAGVELARANTVLVNDGAPTYSIIPTTTSITEGGTVTYNITTTNVPNGTILQATNNGTAANADFDIGSFPISVTITSNTGSFQVRAKTDSLNEGPEYIDVQLNRAGVGVVANAARVTINDVAPQYTITPIPTDIAETESVSYQIYTVNVPTGTTLWLTNAGSLPNSSMTDPADPPYVPFPRPFTITNGYGSVGVTIRDSITFNVIPETIIAQLRTSQYGEVVKTAATVYVRPAYSPTYVPASYISDHIETFP